MGTGRQQGKWPRSCHRRSAGAPITLVFLCAACLSVAACQSTGARAGGDVKPISEWILYPTEALRVLWQSYAEGDPKPPARCQDMIRYLPASSSRPIPHVRIPQHPFMAAHRNNNMHCDAYISDTYEAAGPLGTRSQVRSRTQGFGGYGTIAFDASGRIVGVYSNGRGFQLELMDPWTLRELASYDLPPRPWYFLLQGVLPWKYIGAGMYFYLGSQDRAIVPTTLNSIRVVQVPPAGHPGGFRLVREYDLSRYVVQMRWPRQDSVAWVLPDWNGQYYWYATTQGIVGTIAMDSGAVHTRRLLGEVIENSFAVGEDGVFIISDRALYRFSRDTEGNIKIDWRTTYERGSGPKAGHITRGSGTSVTLMGSTGGFVVVTDNAEPRVHLLFVNRRDGKVACGVPLFEAGKSGTDISAAAFEHADGSGRGTGVYSALVENNWGHHWFPRSHPEPGLTRVDLETTNGTAPTCRTVWTSDERSIGVFKLSLGSGLAYMYWREDGCPATQWYLTAVDFNTGKTVYRRRTGRGLGYNNWAGALFLHPDGGTLYSTTIFGLVMIRDGTG